MHQLAQQACITGLGLTHSYLTSFVSDPNGTAHHRAERSINGVNHPEDASPHFLFEY